MAVDPGDDTSLEDPQSWNKYAYVRNNPVLGTDPTGMLVDWGDPSRLSAEHRSLQTDSGEDTLERMFAEGWEEYCCETTVAEAEPSDPDEAAYGESVGPTNLAWWKIAKPIGQWLTKKVLPKLRKMIKGMPKNMDDLKKLGRPGSGKNVREVVGGADDAKGLFDHLRGSNPVTEVKPGVFVAQGKSGGHVTFRASSKSGPPTVDVNQGGQYVKIKYVKE